MAISVDAQAILSIDIDASFKIQRPRSRDDCIRKKLPVASVVRRGAEKVVANQLDGEMVYCSPIVGHDDGIVIGATDNGIVEGERRRLRVVAHLSADAFARHVAGVLPRHQMPCDNDIGPVVVFVVGRNLHPQGPFAIGVDNVFVNVVVVAIFGLDNLQPVVQYEIIVATDACIVALQLQFGVFTANAEGVACSVIIPGVKPFCLDAASA